VTQVDLDGGPPFGEPLRVSALRIDADADIEAIEVWLSADPIEVPAGCPRPGADDVVVFEGPPTREVVDYGDDGPTADVGTTLAITASRRPCADADCAKRNLEVAVELELSPP